MKINYKGYEIEGSVEEVISLVGRSNNNKSNLVNPWTEEETELLIKLRNQKRSVIAKKLGKTAKQVSDKLSHMKRDRISTKKTGKYIKSGKFKKRKAGRPKGSGRK